ncbi:MAG TPA: hypothetical protein VHE61_12520 [Opitutaceae bacterium]|nr:hypothetical protein [Opitutaceae bacterium]
MSAPSSPHQPWWRPFRTISAWTAVWSVLAVLHVTQAIWLSRGQAYPGDLQDGRFNQLVLEHGFQSLRGVYHWFSPGQFYPVSHTLAYSDTHAGTLAVYALLRELGLSVDRAWQVWFVVIAVLNVIAAFRLLEALNIPDRLRGPLVFASVSSPAMVWLTGTHMQMLPMFPLLFAWAEIVRWCDDRRLIRLLEASGWFAWQFAAGPYLAYFGVIISVAVGLIYLIASPFCGSNRPTTERHDRRKSIGLKPVFLSIVGWSLGLITLGVYLNASGADYGRVAVKFDDYALSPTAWFTPNSVQVLAPLRWVGRYWHTFSVQPGLFAGFLPWIAVIAGIGIGLKNRRQSSGRWTLALSVGSLLVMAFFTRWGGAFPCWWAVTSEAFRPLEAFRAPERIAGPLQVAMVSCAGLVLARWYRADSAPVFAVTTLATLLAVASLSHHQPSVRLADARARTDAMVAAWRRAGDRPVLAFAFGYTNQPSALFHLDAWSAALRLGRVTVNGYSGGLPASHDRFVFDATVDHARELCTQFSLPSDRVSLVEGFGAAADAALGIRHYPQRPLPRLEQFGLQPFAWTVYGRLVQTLMAEIPMYRLIPGTEMSFHVPDTTTRIAYMVTSRREVSARAGYTESVGLAWLLRSAGASDRQFSHETFSPATTADAAAPQLRQVKLPTGHDRVIVLRIDAGPDNSASVGSLCIGRLRAE